MNRTRSDERPRPQNHLPVLESTLDDYPFFVVPKDEGLLADMCEGYVRLARAWHECKDVLAQCRVKEAQLLLVARKKNQRALASQRRNDFLITKLALRLALDQLEAALHQFKLERAPLSMCLRDHAGDSETLGLWRFRPDMERFVAQQNMSAGVELDRVIRQWIRAESRQSPQCFSPVKAPKL